MVGVGIIEGFFGPQWSWQDRQTLCRRLPNYGGSLYLYAPKQDSYLRKNWHENHPAEVWKEIKLLSEVCSEKQIKFGVGLSPFEVHLNWNEKAKRKIKEKVIKLQELNLSYLGIFFDDMKGAPDLAEKQIEIVEFIRTFSTCKILFCPTYYSYDPILDRVFGQREPNYLEKIGLLSSDIEIFWTGNKVISPTIANQDLDDVSRVIKRKPLVWDNYFANDGPKQCKFLKLKPFQGRSKSAHLRSAGWILNPMNQANLSEICFAGAADVLIRDYEPAESVENRMVEFFGPDNFKVIREFNEQFLNVGLDLIVEPDKLKIIDRLVPDRFSNEVVNWLRNQYMVGSECLTD